MPSPRPSTRERILETALGLMNAEGDAGATIAAIADAAGISQGNLHYHFRTRTAIVEALLAGFEQAMNELVDGEIPERVSIDDAWMFLQLLIETVDRHRFLVRDLEAIAHREPRLARRVRRLLARQAEMLRRLCAALGPAASPPADRALIDAIARSMAVAVSFSRTCERWADTTDDHRSRTPGGGIAECAARTLALAAPLLDRNGRAALRRILPA